MPQPMAERAAERRAFRREQLLDVAREVFAERGASVATVEDITTRAGVAKGTFYWYFQSKEHVVAALWQRFLDGFMKEAVDLLESADELGWQEVADRLVAALIDYDLKHRDLHVLISKTARGDAFSVFWEADEQVVEVLAAGIEAGIAAQDFEVQDPKLAAYFLYHGTDAILLSAALRNEPVDRDHLVRGVTQLVHRALAFR